MRFVQNVFALIENDAEHTVARNLFHYAVKHRIARFSGADDEHCAVGVIYQNGGIGKDSERRRVNDYKVEHLTRLTQNFSEFRTGNQFGDIASRFAAGKQMKP